MYKGGAVEMKQDELSVFFKHYEYGAEDYGVPVLWAFVK
jgi:hypothetical protein